MDPGLHHLQGKAELVKPADLLALLQEFYGAKLALYRRHEDGARLVSGYETNNTYQYMLAREDAHLAWLRAAITDLGAAPVDAVTVPPVPAGGKGEAAAHAVVEDDLRLMRAFVEVWRPRLPGVTHARHRKMLDLVFGEVLEHQRFFEQAVAGRGDLLGRRDEGAGTGGGVLPARWVG